MHFIVSYMCLLLCFGFSSELKLSEEVLRPLSEGSEESLQVDVLGEEDSGDEIDIMEAVQSSQEHGDRHARVTCDLLSLSLPWVTANHSLCAARCLAMKKGYKGGFCKNGVCNCRK